MRTNNIKHVTIKPYSIDKERCGNIVSIVVTNNRKALLLRCLHNLINQNVETDILIVNNASTDGTEQDLVERGLLDNKRIHYIWISQNTGGAGGFHHGLKYAYGKKWEWFWLMDDDAEPRTDALKNITHAAEKHNIYGSAAVQRVNDRIKLCFPTKRIGASGTNVAENYEELANIEQVDWLPFLGFFISREAVRKIGLPDKHLFIRNDDIEYALRAKKNGIYLYLVKKSVIFHPFQTTIPFRVFRKELFYRKMPPWKMYYEVRNKIIIAKRHYTLLPSIRSLLGVSFQVFVSIIIEKEKKEYLIMYLIGILDGLSKKNYRAKGANSLQQHKTNDSKAI